MQKLISSIGAPARKAGKQPPRRRAPLAKIVGLQSVHNLAREILDDMARSDLLLGKDAVKALQDAAEGFFEAGFMDVATACVRYRRGHTLERKDIQRACELYDMIGRTYGQPFSAPSRRALDSPQNYVG